MHTMTPQRFESIRLALDYLDAAEAELNRPKEDAVNLCVCLGARKCIMHLLQGYLVLTNGKTYADCTMEELIGHCTQTDRRFAAIDYSCLHCRHTRDEAAGLYCIDPETVKDCVAVAERLKALVLEKLNITGLN